MQIPVFIALYWTILAAVELRYAPLALWIDDLSSPDPFYMLPLLMGISMFVQTKLNPTPTDPLQAKIMQIMPVAFSAIFFFFPAGLVLYSLVNNILSIAQQWKITKMYGTAPSKDTPEPPVSKQVNSSENPETTANSPADSPKQPQTPANNPRKMYKRTRKK